MNKERGLFHRIFRNPFSREVRSNRHWNKMMRKGLQDVEGGRTVSFDDYMDRQHTLNKIEAERRETEEILSSRSRKSRIMKGLRQSKEGKVRYLDEK